MRKILILGANGQLGNEIRELTSVFNSFDFIMSDIEDVDITNFAEFDNYIAFHRPEIVINCAAYTAVDKAESETDTAYLINQTGVKNIALLSEKHKFFPIHISTDYVFDGNAVQPYKETDNTNPQSVYGKSKLAGENAIIHHCSKGIIIRTSWLYSSFGNNFVKTMLNRAKTQPELRIVADQTGSPTYAADLAEVLLNIAMQIDKIQTVEIFHYSNEGSTTWYDFAKAIILPFYPDYKLTPISSKEYPTPAKRPMYSVLDKQKIKSFFHLSIPQWKESLDRCLEKLS